MGFEVVPFLSARMTIDRGHLTDVVKRLDKAEIRNVFVVAGDSEPRGDFFDGLQLLRAMSEIDDAPAFIGVPGYPEGHPFISDATLWEALSAKQAYARYMVTQMCFDPGAITAFTEACRARGIMLPVLIGIPGVAPLRKLAAISARIGVGSSMRFLSAHTSSLGKLVRPGGYAPAQPPCDGVLSRSGVL